MDERVDIPNPEVVDTEETAFLMMSNSPSTVDCIDLVVDTKSGTFTYCISLTYRLPLER